MRCGLVLSSCVALADPWVDVLSCVVRGVVGRPSSQRLAIVFSAPVRNLLSCVRREELLERLEALFVLCLHALF